MAAFEGQFFNFLVRLLFHFLSFVQSLSADLICLFVNLTQLILRFDGLAAYRLQLLGLVQQIIFSVENLFVKRRQHHLTKVCPLLDACVAQVRPPLIDEWPVCFVVLVIFLVPELILQCLILGHQFLKKCSNALSKFFEIALDLVFRVNILDYLFVLYNRLLLDAGHLLLHDRR